MYEQILNALGPGQQRFRTLGGRSWFYARSSGNPRLIIITSSGNHEYKILNEMFDQILERYNWLADHLKTRAGQYVRPKWPECPSDRPSPYVAKLIHLRRTGEL